MHRRVVRGGRTRAAGPAVPAHVVRRGRWRSYGTDKPDLRFGLEIQDATELTRGSQFGVFAGAPVVRYLVAPQAFSRAELGRLEEIAKEWGAKGLAYIVTDESGEMRSPIVKFLSERGARGVRDRARHDGALRRRRPESDVARVLGGLRTHLGRELELAQTGTDVVLWVIDFPLFERDEDTGAGRSSTIRSRRRSPGTRTRSSPIPAARSASTTT